MAMVGWGMGVKPRRVTRVEQIYRPVTIEVRCSTVWIDEYRARWYSTNIRYCPHHLALKKCRGAGPVLVWGGGLLPWLQVLLGRIPTKAE